MFYGLETLLPAGRPFDLLERQYKKMIKHILSLPMNTADPAIYIISGLMPAEAEIHKTAINLFGSICRSGNESTEWQIAARKLSIKNRKSNSWFIEIRKLFIQYRIDDPYSYLSSLLSKTEWKTLIKKNINSYWISQITEKSTLYKSLKLLNGKFQFGRCHSVATTITANIRDIVRLPIRLKIATGTYILQQNRAAYKNSNFVATCLLPVCTRSDVMIGKTHNIWYSGGAEPYAVNRSCVKAKLACGTYTLQKDRSKFSKYSASPTCQLCKSEPEDRLHFLVKCKALEEIRTPFINKLRCYLIDIIRPNLLQELLDNCGNLLQLIIDCSRFHFCH